MRHIILLFSVLSLFACSSVDYKKQGYAKLSNTKDFEEDYKLVWKGMFEAAKEYRVTDSNQEDGEIETDWIYTTSNDKYVEYESNGFPRKHFLQTRYRFKLKAEKMLRKVKVTAKITEEVENIKSDGSFDSWKEISDVDTARENEMIKNIEMKILSRPNI